jgi:hypothetical protein
MSGYVALLICRNQLLVQTRMVIMYQADFPLDETAITTALEKTD